VVINRFGIPTNFLKGFIVSEDNFEVERGRGLNL
jgi:hypothetical protein